MPQESQAPDHDFNYYRRRARMTQKRIAAEVQRQFGLPMNSNVLSSWEGGKVRRPGYDYVKAVAAVLGLSIDELYAAIDRSWSLAHPDESDPPVPRARSRDPAVVQQLVLI